MLKDLASAAHGGRKASHTSRFGRLNCTGRISLSCAGLYVRISKTSIYIHEFYSGKVGLMSCILGFCMLNLKQRQLFCLVGMLSIQRYSDSGQQTCSAACVLEVYKHN